MDRRDALQGLGAIVFSTLTGSFLFSCRKKPIDCEAYKVVNEKEIDKTSYPIKLVINKSDGRLLRMGNFSYKIEDNHGKLFGIGDYENLLHFVEDYVKSRSREITGAMIDNRFLTPEQAQEIAQIICTPKVNFRKLFIAETWIES